MIEALIQRVTIDINATKSQIVGEIVMQVAIYSHDHIGAHKMAFGVLSDRPSLDEEHPEEIEKTQAVLLDQEQRRNEQVPVYEAQL